jgi:hypothetical protein
MSSFEHTRKADRSTGSPDAARTTAIIAIAI